MSSDPVPYPSTRRSFLRNAAIVSAGVGATSLLGSLAAPPPARAAIAIAHPGLLHTDAGLATMRTRTGATTAPWVSGWAAVRADARSRAGWSASPVSALDTGGPEQNYAQLLADAHAAYQNALLWRLTGNTAHANTAQDILNAWSQTLTSISGTPLIGQAAGIYGFVLANAAELVRGHAGFDSERFAAMLTAVVYPASDTYLATTYDSCGPSYATNWELAHIASVLAIGVFCDDVAKIDRAAALVTDTPRIMDAIPYPWVGDTSDRYSGTGLGLLTAICEMAWSQGRDLYASHGNRLLAASEEIARFEAPPPETPTLGTWGTSATSPAWAIIHDHYVTRRGLSAPYTAALADQARAEGGGFDQLGLGLFAYSV